MEDDGTRFISLKIELPSITRTTYFPVAQSTVPQVAQLLRQCSTSRKVAGSIFHGHNPSCRTVALGSTQSLIEMSTRSIFWAVKAAGA
jgi:hypothetical protein